MRTGVVILLAAVSCGVGCSPRHQVTDADANDLDIVSDIAMGVPSWDVPNVVDAVAVDVPVHVGSCVEPEIGDAGDGGDSPDSSDVPRSSNARSCSGASGAPANHCDRVHFCGGTFRMGSTDAWGSTWPALGNYALQRACDVHTVTVFDGWVDAHEVTVARYRAYLRAGHPQPAEGEWIVSDYRWGEQYGDRSFDPHSSAQASGFGPFGPTSCTYQNQPGDHDALPINCVNFEIMRAFCWWEGGHLITEETWEYLATNRGRTTAPMGAVPRDDEICDISDVGTNQSVDLMNPMGATLCPRRMMPLSVFARPRDVTFNPPGVYGLLGGMSEVTLSASGLPVMNLPRCQTTCEPFCIPPHIREGKLGEYVAKGAAWVEPSAERNRRADARQRNSAGNPSAISLGFRCAGWD